MFARLVTRNKLVTRDKLPSLVVLFASLLRTDIWLLRDFCVVGWFSWGLLLHLLILTLVDRVKEIYYYNFYKYSNLIRIIQVRISRTRTF